MFALQPELKVFSGSANRELADRICKYIGVPLGQATISSFPDGETYVRIEENIRGHDVFIIQPPCPPTNQHLMELLIMVDAALGAKIAIVAKERRSATETEALYLIGEVEDHDVLLIDDLTETAGTLTSAAELMKKRGAQKIYAGVSHAVLVDMAIERLQKSKIAELVTTNSTPVRTVQGFKTTVLCVSELLGEGIKRIHNDESVSSLFNIEDKKNGKAS